LVLDSNKNPNEDGERRGAGLRGDIDSMKIRNDETRRRSCYARLAGLFAYPQVGFVGEVVAVQGFLDQTCAEAAAELVEFTQFASQAALSELEELYTRSFDVQAVTTLDLGYVLFGDDYKRGELLVNLNREHKQAGVDCGDELPDHLPNVLRLLDTMDNLDLREELVQKIVAPALRKIIGEFDPEKLEKKNTIYKKHHKTLIERSARHGIIYQKPLRALYAVLQQEFGTRMHDTTARAVVPGQSRFLKSIGTEMTPECNGGTRHGSTK